MRTTLATLLLLGLATSTFAAGVEVTVGDCPGNPGASTDVTLDCACGQKLPLFITFMPYDSVSALAEADLAMDVAFDGELASDASFWDFPGAQSVALSSSPAPPSGCANYRQVFDWTNQGAYYPGPYSRIVVVAIAVDTTLQGLSVSKDERIFAMTIFVDLATSIEAGGSRNGCGHSACWIMSRLQLRRLNGEYVGWEMGYAAGLGNELLINGGPASICGVVPTRKHTWGQLKSLYR